MISVSNPKHMVSQQPMNPDNFFDKGWCQFEYDSRLASWVQGSLPDARKAVLNPIHQQWLRCGGTWFVGVSVLPNSKTGEVGSSGALTGDAIDFIYKELVATDFNWDHAQISVCYPGYPAPGESESPDAYRFRRNRDAAHVDGLLPEGVDRRRHLREHHGFILGIPLVNFSHNASPFVVWEGSHEIIRASFKAHFTHIPPEKWGDQDVTDIYKQTRNLVFEKCRRVEIFAQPGEAFIAHRLVVHGVAAWKDSATAGNDGRMICYFRPEMGGPREWLTAP